MSRYKTVCIRLLYSLALLSLVACSKDLTRSEAKEKILETKNISNLSLNVGLHPSGFTKGIFHKLWDNNGKPTKFGASLINHTDRRSMAILEATDVNIEVTGIVKSTLSDDVTIAEFIWNYSDLSSVLKRYAIDSGSGEAEFQRYDDGWRVQGIRSWNNKRPAVLTASELELESEHESKIEAERLEILEAKRKEQQKKEEQLAKVEKAKEAERIKNLEPEVVNRLKLLSKHIIGKWVGSYECSQGETGLTLIIKSTEYGNLAGTLFDFYPLENNKRVASGAFKVKGLLSTKGDGTFELIPDSWIRRPGSYGMVGLSGRVSVDEEQIKGTIDTKSCNSFYVVKSE